MEYWNKNLMKTTSVTVMVIFQKCDSQSYLITSIFKVHSRQLRANSIFKDV